MQSVSVQGVPLAYERRGAGVPVVVIHGWLGDHRYMAADLEPVFAQTDGWERLYVNLPGHGRTPAPDWLVTQAQVVSLLTEAVLQVTAGRRFALIGSSYGGYLALGLVRAIPEHLLGAALLVPDLPDGDGRRDTPEHQTIVEAPGAFSDLADDEGWVPGRLVEQSRRAVLEIREHEMPAMREADHDFLERLEADYQLPAELASAERPFPHPSLIVTGRQDATVGYEQAWRLRDEFPRATLATLDMAGHWLGRIERPAPFTALILDWLDRMASAPGPDGR